MADQNNERINKRNLIILIVKKAIRDIFEISIFLFFIFYLVETLIHGFISNYFNINILVDIAIISGILMVLFIEAYQSENIINTFNKKDLIIVIIVSVISSVILYFKLKEIGKLAIIISAVAGIMMFLFSIQLSCQSSSSESFDNKDN